VKVATLPLKAAPSLALTLTAFAVMAASATVAVPPRLTQRPFGSVIWIEVKNAPAVA
jgi:hypothetical protein